MTAQDIVKAAIGSGKELTPERVLKVKKLCERMKVPVADVVELLPAKEKIKFA